MSINEIRAEAYSAKCASRRNRKASRRNKRLDKLASFSLSFSIGLLAAVSLIAVVVSI